VPALVFYNYWNSPQTWLQSSRGVPCEQWGCAIASATEVKQLLRTNSKNGNRLDQIGPASMPWLMLVCLPPADDATGDLPSRVAATLRERFRLRRPPKARELPEYVRRILSGPSGEGEAVPPDGLEFLKGLVVISDRPVERRS
jgi:hypothetical protein